MDSTAGCSSPFFWSKLLKKRGVLKKNVSYNVKSSVKKNDSNQAETYYKYDKYRPSVGEEDIIDFATKYEREEQIREIIYQEKILDECSFENFRNGGKIIICDRKYHENIVLGFENLTLEKSDKHACCCSKYCENDTRKKSKHEIELRQIIEEALKFKPEKRQSEVEKKITSKQSDGKRGKQEKLRARNTHVTARESSSSENSYDEEKSSHFHYNLKSYQEKYTYKRRCSAEKRLLFRDRCKSNQTVFNADKRTPGEIKSSARFTRQQNQAVLLKVQNVRCTKAHSTLNKKRWQKLKVKTESSLSYGSTRSSSDHLDAILLQMRDVSERKKELEKEQAETLSSLRDKQNELQWRSNCSASEKVKICETIEALQSKIRELEKKMELQNVHHEELLLEMAAIKRTSSSQQRSSLPGNYTTSPWKKPNASNQEVQTSPESNASELNYLDRLTPSTSNSYDSGNIYENRPANYRSRPHIHGCPTNIAPSSSYVDLHLASLDPSARYSINTNTAVACKSYWSQSEPPCTCPVSSDQELTSATPSNESACSDDSGIQNVSISHNSSITVDIDKIMAKIDQDNRILAELDKTRSTIATQGSMTAEQLRNISEMGIIPPASCQGMLPVMQSSGLPMTTSQTTINPPISLSNTFSSYLQQYDLSNSMRPSMGSMFPMQLSQQMPQIPVSQSTFSILQSNYPGNYSQMSSNLLQSQFDLDARAMKNGNMPGSGFASTSDLLLPHEDLMMEGPSRRTQDMVEIPGKGLCNIFISKYSYDPFSQSTSICPEAELAINAGDYLLVYGDPDDDGYVDAELMDGRRGLVPIIFIQKLSGDELLEFNQRVLMGMKEGDDSASTTIPQDIENIHTDEHGKKFRPDYNLGGTTEEEEDADESESVPAPKQLTLERQLNKSILIRWNAPEDSPSHCIDSYHVYVDGVLKTTIKANERTKALLEGVDSNKPHRISVRSVTQNRRTSRDAACTMLIGKDVPCYPTNVKAHHVTATSAVISWMPSNSNYQHTVCVNNVEVRTVKPGVYRHTITGLVPNTIYRVTVRAKNIRAPQFDDKTASDKYASHIDFRTLPKGMPDPPSEIQVEVGPQDGTLLVTWIPVTVESANGAPVTGYAVYADGKKVTDIDSPTGDHALIDISKIISMNPRHVTVRTKSKENQSCDSNATPIPSSAIKARHHSSKGNSYGRHQARNAYGQVIIDPEENLSDKEVYPGQSSSVPAIEITKENPADENYSEEEFLETHRSNRNIRYNQPPPPRSHGPPRSHLERGRPPPPHSGHERVLPRPNYDVRSYDMRRDNREYHHSPARSADRRARVINDPHMKPNRGPTQSQPSPVNRQHPAPATATPDDKSRLVVALFDYDPSSMSPNPATSHEELAFSAGDQIKILSEKDPDGFYWGECHGKQGYVPQNMITDLENAPKTLLKKIKQHTRYSDIRHSAKAKKMIALYDYDPHENSPNLDSDAEISFSQGQIIYVKGEPDDDGFYLGEVDGMQGLVPSNYLQEIDEYQDDDRQAHVGQSNRGVVRPIPQRDRNRGHGPGARGPPPPPRDGMPPRSDVRDRRKDARPQYENQQDQIRNAGRTGEGRLLDRRTGRELPSVKGDHYGNMLTRENNTGTIASNLQNNDPNRSSFRTNRTRGAPNAIPELSANKPTNAPPSTGTGLKFPESPNIMQKLSEITSNAENPVDNILSKGKELIFMKFGLGK